MSLLLILLPAIMTPSDTLGHTPLQELLPSSLRQWHVSEAARSYSGRQIFDYMDGAGEVYLAYGFKDLLVQRYARPNQEEILVEIFDMGSSQDAFGIFTSMKGRGPAVPIGREGEYRSGLLCFWKGSYFVCVRIENENKQATQAVLDLGKQISSAIREEGEKPAILRHLPTNEYIPSTLRYFHRHEILSIHFYVADANIFRLNDRTEAVLVRLKRDKSYLLLLGYPDSQEADSGYASFLAHYMPDSKEAGMVKTENNKWTACVKKANFLAILFDAVTRQQATDLLRNVERSLP